LLKQPSFLNSVIFTLLQRVLIIGLNIVKDNILLSLQMNMPFLAIHQ